MSTLGMLNTLGVVGIIDGIRAGQFTAEEVVRACLARIREREPVVRAWTHLDDDAVRRAREIPSGPLCGVPFGIKDVIDSSALPTEVGSSLYEGYRPRFDAGCVALARQAGAVALGKTVSAEFAGTQPTRTTNPHRAGRTPGGSSSGSAAAVADNMVPFAFGTQTGGSVLRPAAFCGIVGFKPSFGLYSISGVKTAAPSFDTVGLLARSVEDIAAVHGCLMGSAGPFLTQPAKRPRFGVFRSHLWPTVQPDAQAAFEGALRALEAAGGTLTEIAPPSGFDTITEHRAVINAFERARGLAGEWETGSGAFSPQSRDVYQRGISISGDRYLAARRQVDGFRRLMDRLLDDVDVLITPTTPGEAPEGLDYAGDPRLQELWTMLHLPSITVPFGSGESGMPLGIQLVGGRYQDADLLACASWLSRLAPLQGPVG